MVRENITRIIEEGKEAFALATEEMVFAELEKKYLGRKSELSDILKGLKDLSPEEKKEAGPLANEGRRVLGAAAEEARTRITSLKLASEEHIDVTIPGKKPAVGHLHPVTRLTHEIEDIFSSLGFSVVGGQEVETEFYNFDALNIPSDHPARDMQDTFWIDSEGLDSQYVLRTHTSSVQVRYMEAHTPPFRIVIPGRAFRNEATDASHEHTYHQFECLMVDEAGKVTVAHFKHIAEVFFREFFGRDIAVRLRPSFFPFTEPSFEFDISCVLCEARGCPVCKQSGWLEIGGAGMIHQKVFEKAGYEAGKYQGFAWGFGLTRLAMMKYGVSDIRMFMDGDIRFIRQF